MKIVNRTLSHMKENYPLENIAPKESILFLDIETTGFVSKTSTLYLIGGIYFKDNSFHLIQWFAETMEEEKEVLLAFIEFSKNFSHLIHFNGNNFDLPFLLQKASQYNIPLNFDHFSGIDLYRRIAPYKNLLKLPNCKQKTIETFLNINREDTYSGGELIQIYKNYCISPTIPDLNTLLLHNADDIQGMVLLLPTLSYSDIFHSGITVSKAQVNSYLDHNGVKHQELIMKIKFSNPLPIAISLRSLSCYFTGNQLSGSLRVPIFEEELKYFYANYRSYYYLPIEDMALHKSVATYVDKEHIEKATKSNCYTKKSGLFLPQWDIVNEPYFKRTYEDDSLFFELADDIKTNRTMFHNYAQHVLGEMICSK